MDKPEIRAGVGVMIFKDAKVLVGFRWASHGVGEYAFPGGNLEYMESFEECVRREVREEVGIELQNIRFQFLGNLKTYAPKHYIQLGFIADWASGEPQTLEPDKTGDWEWYDPNSLPEPLFYPSRLLLDSCRTGNHYLDS